MGVWVGNGNDDYNNNVDLK